MIAATALIAEDEPLLAAALQVELARLWPELRVVANVGDGAAAVDAALKERPQLLFLDIRMPGMNGLEAAQAIAEDWPDAVAEPLLVFVTAYDQYALEAFGHAAVDYLLKPVDPQRLARTCERAEAALRRRSESAGAAVPPWDAALDQLRHLLAAPALAAQPQAHRKPKLEVIQAGSGNTIHMVPVAEVVYFEAADKYVRVVTGQREYLIRIALRELMPQLDESRFWPIHRGTVVRADAIEAALRDEAGKLSLVLRGRPERLNVSRLYAHVFKAM
ncbi:MAG: LytTR family DNA-binding domain-containing protein [Pseudomonadota bacterium]|nr:LytTR family DNA-binding domain-containing protein [Pseudomonadota bacterium]